MTSSSVRKEYEGGAVMRYFQQRELSVCIALLYNTPVPMPIVLFFKPGKITEGTLTA